MNLSRRGFLGRALAVAVLVPLADFESVLEVARPAQLTLVDYAVRFPGDHHLQQISDLLTASNDLLDDLPWSTGNTVMRTSLPPGSWRMISRGA